jgi:predicted secreted protein
MRAGRFGSSVFVIVVAAALAACSVSSTPTVPRDSLGRAELLITEEDFDRTVGIQLGQSVTLNLAADPGQGLEWTIAPLLDADVVAIDGPQFHPVNGTPGPGVDVWRFRGVGPGSVTVSLTYAPTSNPSDVRKSFRFVVSVA